MKVTDNAALSQEPGCKTIMADAKGFVMPET